MSKKKSEWKKERKE